MQFSDTNQDLGTTLRGTIGRIQGKTITLRALMEDMGEQGLLPVSYTHLTLPTNREV